jgi:glycosyltransferase involved in cell wall biosynthesis
MAQKIKLGLVYSYNENWIGGTYYILNLIHALQTIDDKDKPEITVFSESEERFEELKEITKYPFLKFKSLNISLNKFQTLSNRVSKKLFKHKFYNSSQLKPVKVDFLYPSPIKSMDCSHIKHVEWIPDFQEIHLPEFFSIQEIRNRYKRHQYIAQHADIVVFSSEDARKDFINLFPTYSCEIFVLQFAVTHQKVDPTNFEQVGLKYQLDRAYFFTPNQFWIHKNHIVIIEALKIAVETKPDLLIAFSGKEADNRTSGHVEHLKNLVVEYGLENNVKFLGFLPREDQVLILRNSIAVIQPSLFEGWSTVVEDAKAQGKFLVLSNIDVHKEQVKKNVTFFNPREARELAHIIIKEQQGFKNEEEIDYSILINDFAKDFMNLMAKA